MAERKLRVRCHWKAIEQLKSAASVDELLAALRRRISKLYLDQNSNPVTVPSQRHLPTTHEERRRSGSHYTPRSLTQPIVKTTLDPVLAQLGDNPTPEQILALKVCDPAMGSGAFLVEACRYLGEKLEKAWISHARCRRSQRTRTRSYTPAASWRNDVFTAWTKIPSR